MLKVNQTGGMFIVICGDSRLCQDDRWSIFAMFGTTQGCVKVYKTEAGAKRKARFLRQHPYVPHNTGNKPSVVAIPNGYSMDAAGNVFDQHDNQKELSEFVVYSPQLLP